MFRRSPILLLVLAPLACAPHPKPPAPESPIMAGRMKTPYPEIVWTKGPSLVPKAALVAWLDSQGPDRLVRMPVTIHFRPDGLGIDRGTVGELDLRLDDTRLGVSLMDHARQASPERSSVALHLEGHWQGVKDGRGVLSLHRVHRQVVTGVDYAEADSAR